MRGFAGGLSQTAIGRVGYVDRQNFGMDQKI